VPILKYGRTPTNLNTSKVTTEIIRAIAAQATREAAIEYPSTITTSGAVTSEIKNITVGTGETGLLEVHIVGSETTGTGGITGRYIVHYCKDNTDTLSIVSLDALFQDDIGAAGITISDDGTDNISIEVTGIAALDINWACFTYQKTLTATALP
jgi:hypothetical protein